MKKYIFFIRQYRIILSADAGADDTAAAYDVWFDGTIGLKQVLENMGRSQVSTYFTWASDTHMAVTYYKKKTR